MPDGFAPTPNFFQTPSYNELYNYDYYQPQTSRSGAIASGLINSIERRKAVERQQEADARSNALKWLQTVPMTSQNAPIVTKMALDILSAKPGKKHWSDQLFGTGQASNKFVDDLWDKLKGIMPPPGVNEEEETGGAQGQAGPGSQAGGQAAPTAVASAEEPPMKYPESGQFGQWGTPPMSPLPGGRLPVTNYREDLGGMAQAPATEAISGQIAQAAQPNALNQNLPPRPAIGPAIDRTKLSFANLPGRWTTYPTPVFDQAGNMKLLQYDQHTGQRRFVEMGQVTTEKEQVAQINANRKVNAIDDAAQKGLLQRVYDLAAAAGYTRDMFKQLPWEAQEPIYSKAGVMGTQATLGNLAKTTAQTQLAQANVPVAQEKAKLYARTAQLGGLSPAQAQADYRVNLEAARKYAKDYTDLVSKATAAKQALDDFDNPKTSMGRLMQQYPTDRQTEYRIGLQRAYTQAAEDAKAKLAAAEETYPGLLQRVGSSGLQVIATNPPAGPNMPGAPGQLYYTPPQGKTGNEIFDLNRPMGGGAATQPTAPQTGAPPNISMNLQTGKPTTMEEAQADVANKRQAFETARDAYMSAPGIKGKIPTTIGGRSIVPYTRKILHADEEITTPTGTYRVVRVATPGKPGDLRTRLYEIEKIK